MTDLTFCYHHMTDFDLQTLDTLESEFMDGELSDEELEIPFHMVPPDPDDADTLPSQMHPSYPYGNPTNLSHPAALPHINGESGRALYEDIGYTSGGVNSALRWKNIGLEMLLPVNEEKEEAERAALARKMANGATQSNQAGASAPGDTQNDEDETDSGEGDEEEEDEDNDEDDEDDEDENDMYPGSFDSGMTGESE